MFEHFTFGPTGLDRFRHEISPSPTDNSFPPSISLPTACPPIDREMCVTQASINEIMSRFRDQTIQPREELAHHPEWTPHSSAPCQENNGTFSHTSSRANYSQSLPNIHFTPAPRPGPVGCKRLQRQINVQLQTTKSHIRDVKALVEDMIMTNSQCVLHEAVSRPSLHTPPPSRDGEPCALMVDPVVDKVDDPMGFDSNPPMTEASTDEGFHEGDEPIPEEKFAEKFVYRRACAPAGIRKSTIKAEWARGADHIVAGGRVLVRSIPRMRKRRSRPPRAPE